jgi:hypothetical protein
MDRKERDCESVVWIKLAQNRNQWRILANTVTNLFDSIKGSNFLKA